MTIWYKEHSKQVLALADEELMDKEFEEGEFILSVGEFYKGRLMRREEVAKLVSKAVTINAVGKESTRLLIKIGLATERHIKQVQGIPHLQIFLI